MDSNVNSPTSGSFFEEEKSLSAKKNFDSFYNEVSSVKEALLCETSQLLSPPELPSPSTKPSNALVTLAERRMQKILHLGGVIENCLNEGLSNEYVQGLVDQYRYLLDKYLEAKAAFGDPEEGQKDSGELERICEESWGSFLMKMALLNKDTESSEGKPEVEQKVSILQAIKKPLEHDGKTESFLAFWRRFHLCILEQEDFLFENPEQFKLQSLLSAVHVSDSAVIAATCSTIFEAEVYLKRKYLSPEAIRAFVEGRLRSSNKDGEKVRKIRSRIDREGLVILRKFLEEVMLLVEVMEVQSFSEKAAEVENIFDLLHNRLSQTLSQELSVIIAGNEKEQKGLIL